MGTNGQSIADSDAADVDRRIAEGCSPSVSWRADMLKPIGVSKIDLLEA
jgi:hypothetical protein